MRCAKIDGNEVVRYKNKVQVCLTVMVQLVVRAVLVFTINALSISFPDWSRNFSTSLCLDETMV